MDEEQNLQDLFSTLNQISADSMMGGRTGGGTGGGSMNTSGNMDPNPLIRLNPYIAKNVTSFRDGGLVNSVFRGGGRMAPMYNVGGPMYNVGGMYQQPMMHTTPQMAEAPMSYEDQANGMIALQQMGNLMRNTMQRQYQPPMADEGMKFSKKELDKIAKAGRFGDTQLAHVTPEESALLQALGGSGTINPYTGLPEHFRFLKRLASALSGGAKSVLKPVSNIVTPVVKPVFGAANTVLNKAGKNIINPVVQGAGGGFRSLINRIAKGATNVAKTGLGATADITQAVGKNIVNPVVAPVMDLAMDATKPVMEGISNVVEPIMAGATDVFGNVIDAGFDLTKALGHDVLIPGARFLGDLLTGGGGGSQSPYGGPTTMLTDAAKRPEVARYQGETMPSDVKLSEFALSKLKKSNQDSYVPGDWVGSKESPFISPNVEDEIDYAAKGMKYKYQEGGNYPHNMYHPETGYKIVAEDESAHNKLSKAGFDHTPKAAYGMKMKKRYVQGGRF